MISVERCRKLYNEGKLPQCIFFFRPSNEIKGKGIFSQWFMHDFSDGVYTYSSAEQYMMSQKAAIFGDMDTFNLIMRESDPYKLKKYGRMVRNFDEKIWDAEKYSVVLNGNILKFKEGLLKDALLSSKDAILVEASPYDRIWGIGLKEDDAGINDPNNWRGENLLGRAIMEARTIIKMIK